MGLVIGKKGTTIKQIEMQSGAKLTKSEGKHEPGFMVHGSENERIRAIELVNGKLVSAIFILVCLKNISIDIRTKYRTF